MGNVPFAVALWGGGVSFAGVIAFVYADLITVPVLNVYRKYYGWSVMLYILGVFFVTMAFTGFLMEQLFSVLGSSPIRWWHDCERADLFRTELYVLPQSDRVRTLSGFLLYVYRRGLGSTRSVPILSVECEPARMVQPSSTMVIPTISVRRRVDEPSRRHLRSSL